MTKHMRGLYRLGSEMDSAAEAGQEDYTQLPATAICSRCRSKEPMCNSTIRWFDIPLLFLLLRPMRCLSCYKRTYKWCNLKRSSIA
jgi:hypothetical protein